LITELIVYSLLLLLPTLEMIRSYKANQAKEQKKKDFLVSMQDDVEKLIHIHYQNTIDISGAKERLKKLNENIYLV
jgi:hypothetical protein